ncbi:hypothetical protein PCE1_004272 [Barthelona sp. PCE]
MDSSVKKLRALDSSSTPISRYRPFIPKHKTLSHQRIIKRKNIVDFTDPLAANPKTELIKKGLKLGTRKQPIYVTNLLRNRQRITRSRAYRDHGLRNIPKNVSRKNHNKRPYGSSRMLYNFPNLLISFGHQRTTKELYIDIQKQFEHREREEVLFYETNDGVVKTIEDLRQAGYLNQFKNDSVALFPLSHNVVQDFTVEGQNIHLRHRPPRKPGYAIMRVRKGTGKKASIHVVQKSNSLKEFKQYQQHFRNHSVNSIVREKIRDEIYELMGKHAEILEGSTGLRRYKSSISMNSLQSALKALNVQELASNALRSAPASPRTASALDSSFKAEFEDATMLRSEVGTPLTDWGTGPVTPVEIPMDQEVLFFEEVKEEEVHLPPLHRSVSFSGIGSTLPSVGSMRRSTSLSSHGVGLMQLGAPSFDPIHEITQHSFLLDLDDSLLQSTPGQKDPRQLRPKTPPKLLVLEFESAPAEPSIQLFDVLSMIGQSQPLFEQEKEDEEESHLSEEEPTPPVSRQSTPKQSRQATPQVSKSIFDFITDEELAVLEANEAEMMEIHDVESMMAEKKRRLKDRLRAIEKERQVQLKKEQEKMKKKLEQDEAEEKRKHRLPSFKNVKSRFATPKPKPKQIETEVKKLEVVDSKRERPSSALDEEDDIKSTPKKKKPVKKGENKPKRRKPKKAFSTEEWLKKRKKKPQGRQIKPNNNELLRMLEEEEQRERENKQKELVEEILRKSHSSQSSRTASRQSELLTNRSTMSNASEMFFFDDIPEAEQRPSSVGFKQRKALKSRSDRKPKERRGSMFGLEDDLPPIEEEGGVPDIIEEIEQAALENEEEVQKEKERVEREKRIAEERERKKNQKDLNVKHSTKNNQKVKEMRSQKKERKIMQEMDIWTRKQIKIQQKAEAREKKKMAVLDKYSKRMNIKIVKEQERLERERLRRIKEEHERRLRMEEREQRLMEAADDYSKYREHKDATIQLLEDRKRTDKLYSRRLSVLEEHIFQPTSVIEFFNETPSEDNLDYLGAIGEVVEEEYDTVSEGELSTDEELDLLKGRIVKQVSLSDLSLPQAKLLTQQSFRVNVESVENAEDFLKRMHRANRLDKFVFVENDLWEHPTINESWVEMVEPPQPVVIVDEPSSSEEEPEPEPEPEEKVEEEKFHAIMYADEAPIEKQASSATLEMQRLEEERQKKLDDQAEYAQKMEEILEQERLEKEKEDQLTIITLINELTTKVNFEIALESKLRDMDDSIELVSARSEVDRIEEFEKQMDFEMPSYLYSRVGTPDIERGSFLFRSDKIFVDTLEKRERLFDEAINIGRVQDNVDKVALISPFDLSKLKRKELNTEPSARQLTYRDHLELKSSRQTDELDRIQRKINTRKKVKVTKADAGKENNVRFARLDYSHMKTKKKTIFERKSEESKARVRQAIKQMRRQWLEEAGKASNGYFTVPPVEKEDGAYHLKTTSQFLEHEADDNDSVVNFSGGVVPDVSSMEDPLMNHIEEYSHIVNKKFGVTDKVFEVHDVMSDFKGVYFPNYTIQYAGED